MSIVSLVPLCIVLMFSYESGGQPASVRAFLHNPSDRMIVIRYPYEREADTIWLAPSLVLDGE